MCVMDTGQQTQLEGVMFLLWRRIRKLQTVTAGSGSDTARPTPSWLPSLLSGPCGDRSTRDGATPGSERVSRGKKSVHCAPGKIRGIRSEFEGVALSEGPCGGT